MKRRTIFIIPSLMLPMPIIFIFNDCCGVAYAAKHHHHRDQQQPSQKKILSTLKSSRKVAHPSSNLMDLVPDVRRRRRKRLHRLQLFNPLDRIRNINNNNRLTQQQQSNHVPSKKYQMYLTCLSIVFIWQTLGTLFYSYYYNWPIPQSFFYSVDAGMSIGFCTDVHETEVGSRLFTIIHILLGASCVGGALILMVGSVLEGVASRTAAVYKLILERDSLSKAFMGTQRGKFGGSVLRHPQNWVDEKERGVLSYNDFRKVLYRNGNGGLAMNDKEFQRVCTFYDPRHEGRIQYDYFAEHFQGIHRIVPQSRFVHYSNKATFEFATRMWDFLSSLFTNEYHRIYLIFVLWVVMGVTWGIIDQKWDPITSTHFAISALATGGLTAPPVDSDSGILPTGPALFCGFYCLFGIPLMALTMATIARVLVEGYIVDEELATITRPLTQTECQFASKSLCSTDSAIHLSDYIVSTV